MKRKLLRCVTALAALLSASCSSDPYLSLIPDNGGVTGEEVEVTFSISAEASPAMTRADGDSNGTENDESKVNTPGGPGQWQTNIGRGKNIDMLIYAVYEKHTDSKGKDEYILLSQYGKEAPATLQGSSALPEAEVKNRLDQAILDVSGTLGEGKSQTITLRLMRNKEYYIAFWAQSSQTTAFKTDNLENVQVRYDNAKNNDELRDAFCKVESFSVSPATENSTHAVILTRPMAQINVGTTGADYKHLMKGKEVYPNKRITHSKISLSRVAQYLNVLTDQVLTEENGESTLTNVEFAYDFIPALQFMKDDYRNNLLAAEKEDYLYPYWYNGKEYYKNGTIYEETQEEFLKVNLNDDDKIYRYKANYPTIAPDPDNEGNTLFLTETFKYLSMCYVLVPAEHIPASTEPKYTYANSLLDKVTVTFAENTLNDGTYQDYQTIQLKSVPVHRNWRTNILGGLKYMKDPTDPDPDDPGYPTPDPEDPDDPDNPDPDPDDPTPDPEDPDEPTPTPPGDEGPDDTSVFKFTNILLSVDPIYKGEYTSDEDPKWEEWLQDPNNSTTGGDDDTTGDNDPEEEGGDTQGED